MTYPFVKTTKTSKFIDTVSHCKTWVYVAPEKNLAHIAAAFKFGPETGAGFWTDNPGADSFAMRAMHISLRAIFVAGAGRMFFGKLGVFSDYILIIR
jgi:hypothetical protein